MKTLDVIAAVLVVVGAANWGLVGLLDFDLVATVFGEMTLLSRLVYVVVGLAGLFQAVQWRSIRSRWSGAPATA